MATLSPRPHAVLQVEKEAGTSQRREGSSVLGPVAWGSSRGGKGFWMPTATLELVVCKQPLGRKVPKCPQHR